MINWEKNNQLTNLTHFDGRNSRKLVKLRPYFSEFAWIKIRLEMMIAYLLWISKILKNRISAKDQNHLKLLTGKFDLKEAEKIQKFEKTTNHDLKAIEIYLSEKLPQELRRYINLGLGAEDINSLALGSIFNNVRREICVPLLKDLITRLGQLSAAEKNTFMVARTHAQPANITTFGKEIAVSLNRLLDEAEIFKALKFTAKCTGEVGSFQGLYAVSDKIDWLTKTDEFIKSFDLVPSHATTQIAPYDGLVRFLQSLFRMNNILIDFSKNIWLMVLMGFLKVKPVKKEVGSSGMPHKVNPIYFEGAEGGLVFANGVIETLTRQLPVNRLDRDFSDSTVRRNLVIPVAYALLSYESLSTGLRRLSVDRETIGHDLADHPEIWLETVKAFGLYHGIGDLYDQLKRETRGQKITWQKLQKIIDNLPLNEIDKKSLFRLINKPDNHYPESIVKEVIGKSRKNL